MRASLAELRAAEREVEREWQWLHDALNTVARARAEGADAVKQGEECAPQTPDCATLGYIRSYIACSTVKPAGHHQSR
jgi:hypothetical protein